MVTRFGTMPSYLSFLGVAMIIIVVLLPVTLPVGDDISVPDSTRHYAIAPLTRGVAVVQQFPTAGGKIDSVALLFGTYQRTNPGNLQLEMRANRDGGWKTLASQTVETAALRDNAYHTFAFSPPLLVSAGEQVQIVVQSDDTTAQGVSVFATPEWHQPDGYMLTVSDTPQPSTALFRVTYRRASGHLFQMFGPIWRRSTVLLSARWQLVLGTALGALLVGVVALGRRLPDRIPPPE